VFAFILISTDNYYSLLDGFLQCFCLYQLSYMKQSTNQSINVAATTRTKTILDYQIRNQLIYFFS